MNTPELADATCAERLVPVEVALELARASTTDTDPVLLRRVLAGLYRL